MIEVSKVETAPFCKVCNGARIIPKRLEDGSVYLEDCSCVKKSVEEYQYEKANIPRQYWDFSFESLNDKFMERNAAQFKIVEEYSKNLRDNITNGNGLWFCSATGLGKSTVIVSILKLALQQGYRSYFIRTSKAVGAKFDALRNYQSADLINYIVDSVHILALEEIDKVFLSNDAAMNNQLYYEFLSEIYESKKALLVSSNTLPKEVMKKYPTFIQDRLRSLVPVVFVGVRSERGTKRTHGKS